MGSWAAAASLLNLTPLRGDLRCHGASVVARRVKSPPGKASAWSREAAIREDSIQSWDILVYRIKLSELPLY